MFSGANGHGKTNLLEAIYVLAALRSFRTPRLAHVIAFSSETAQLSGRVVGRLGARQHEIEVSPRRRTVSLDGKAIRSVARYVADFRVVLFAPEDLAVLRSAPAPRRRFLDRAVFQAQPEHLSGVRDYEKSLRNRNALLRDLAQANRPPHRDLLDVFDEQLARLGTNVITRRRRYLAQLEPEIQRAHQAITGHDTGVSLRYISDAGELPASESDLVVVLREQLAARRRADLARGATSVGPHRHDVDFLLADQPAICFASQGQFRTLLLAWKTAELELLECLHGEPPILLLDDVSSELDPSRNQYLFAFLQQRRNQCFITTTHAKHVLLSADRFDYHVRSGQITPEFAR